MARHREHIHRLRYQRLIPVLIHKRQITRQRCRIAGHINNALRLHLRNRRQHLLLAAGTRRIYNHNVRTHAASQQLRQLNRCITADKFRIAALVLFRILLRILDSRRHDFNA